MTDVLLHLCSPADWRTALTSGEIAPPSLAEVGFVHLSTPEQVELPAQRLFAGRRDMLLLAVAPDRLDRAGIDVRWEPGVPGDPESMRFPHAYAAVPATAVLDVLPYRPDDDGRFTAPAVGPLDDAGRATRHQRSVLRRAATREMPVSAGVAVLTDPLPSSPMHNQLLLDGPVDPAAVVADAERVLGGAGRARRSALVAGPDTGGTDGLRGYGWQVVELVTMAAPVAALADAPVSGAAEPVRPDELDGAARFPGLAGRYRLEDTVVDVRCLAVREGDEIVAACLLRCDGGTAWLDGLGTEPPARRPADASALVRAAIDTARDAGCDLLALRTPAGADAHRWYASLGLAEAGRTVVAVRA